MVYAIIPAALLAAAAQGQENPVHGYWETPEDTSIVQLQACDEGSGDLCGEIAWLAESEPQRDLENPDEDLRGRELVGLDILRGFNRRAEGRYGGGEVYNPDDGRTYSGEIRQTGPDTLELEGCALAIFCKEQTWERVPPGDPRLQSDS